MTLHRPVSRAGGTKVILGALVEHAADVVDGFDAPLAAGSDQIEQTLDLGVVHDHLPVIVDVD